MLLINIVAAVSHIIYEMNMEGTQLKAYTIKYKHVAVCIIDDLISKLRDDDIWIRQEDTAEGFLGIDIHSEGNKPILSQPGLTKFIIEELGLYSQNSMPIQVLAKWSPLA